MSVVTVRVAPSVARLLSLGRLSAVQSSFQDDNLRGYLEGLITLRDAFLLLWPTSRQTNAAKRPESVVSSAARQRMHIVEHGQNMRARTPAKTFSPPRYSGFARALSLKYTLPLAAAVSSGLQAGGGGGHPRRWRPRPEDEL